MKTGKFTGQGLTFNGRTYIFSWFHYFSNHFNYNICGVRDVKARNKQVN